MARVLQLRRGTNAENNLFTGAVGELTVDTTNEVLRIHDGATQGGTTVGLDAGFMAPFAGTTAPDGWLICDGSAVSRTDYARLFAAIGTTYGDGDGNTTFNLPNLDGGLPLFDSSATIGSQTDGKAPNIKGWCLAGSYYVAAGFNSGTAPFYAGGNHTLQFQRSGGQSQTQPELGFDASLSSAVYDNDATALVPAGVYTLWCIKY